MIDISMAASAMGRRGGKAGTGARLFPVTGTRRETPTPGTAQIGRQPERRPTSPAGQHRPSETDPGKSRVVVFLARKISPATLDKAQALAHI